MYAFGARWNRAHAGVVTVALGALIFAAGGGTPGPRLSADQPPSASQASTPGGASLPDTISLQGATYDPATDAGSPANLAREIGATSLWQQGFYGQGVGVALIDSGVAPVPGIAENLYYGPDLTPESEDSNLRDGDTYGHGTFMAGLIAGRASGASRPYLNGAGFVGVAPEAKVISVKVADEVGDTDEATVVAAIDWCVQHRDDPGINLRVISLSLGAPYSDYQQSPLAAAVERAWNQGLVVVASAGNDGVSGLLLPAADPYVLAVGAADTKGTASTSDDTVADFSNTGNARRDPDLVAPGTHLVSLRDTNSYVDAHFGANSSLTPTLMRGSGTSEATAVTAGAAALLLSQRPYLTNDQVKTLLTESARPLRGMSAAQVGRGELDLAATVALGNPGGSQYYPYADDFGTPSSYWWGGTWTNRSWVDAQYLAAPTRAGPIAFVSSAWTSSAWTSSAWTSSAWTSSAWTSSAWTSSAWTSSAWTGNWR